MFFFLKITGTNYWTLESPFPTHDIPPTKPQRSQPLINSSQNNADAPKTRALRGSIKSCHHQNTMQTRKVVDLPGSQESSDKLPTPLSGRWLHENILPTPSRFLPSQKLCGGFSETPPITRNRKSDHLPSPPDGSGTEPAGALTLEEQDAQQWKQSVARASSRSALLHPDSSPDACTPCLPLPVTTQVTPEVT